MSWAPWLLFTGVPARFVVLRLRCPGPLGSLSRVRPLGALPCLCSVLGIFGSCSPVCPLSVLCCLSRVLGHLAPVHQFARSVLCFACAVSWATWLLFTGVRAPSFALLVRCPGPLGSCSPVCPLGVLWFVCGVLGHLAPVHRCARSLFCVACAVSRATRLLCSGVPARCDALRARCPGPLGSCSPVCSLGVLCWLCGVLGPLAPVCRCARSVCYVACTVSWAPWLLFTGVPARCVVLRVRCPVGLGSCSLVCPLNVSRCMYGVLGPLPPVHRCARSVCCVVCEVSWATCLLITGAPARCVAFRVPCPRPLGSCAPVCPLGVLCCAYGVLGPLAPVHWSAPLVCCVACTVSWATWLLFTGLPARCVVLPVPCPGPLASSSPVCLLGVLCWVCGVLGVGSFSSVCPLGVLHCVYGVLRPLPVDHQCARSVCCLGCAVSWATWLLFTGVPARCVSLQVRCPGPLGSCSPVCPLGVFRCRYGVLGPLAPVHR